MMQPRGRRPEICTCPFLVGTTLCRSSNTSDTLITEAALLLETFRVSLTVFQHAELRLALSCPPDEDPRNSTSTPRHHFASFIHSHHDQVDIARVGCNLWAQVLQCQTILILRRIFMEHDRVLRSTLPQLGGTASSPTFPRAIRSGALDEAVTHRGCTQCGSIDKISIHAYSSSCFAMFPASNCQQRQPAYYTPSEVRSLYQVRFSARRSRSITAYRRCANDRSTIQLRLPSLCC